MTKPVLYDYWRSPASYRVRIAPNLKGIANEARPGIAAIGAARGTLDAFAAVHPDRIGPPSESS